MLVVTNSNLLLFVIQSFVLLFSDHQNYFGVDDNLGPIAVSIKREKLDERENHLGKSEAGLYQYRVIVRTSEVRLKSIEINKLSQRKCHGFNKGSSEKLLTCML